jgi:hypothetical protein
LRFAYLPLSVRQASPTLRGATVRYRPIVPIHILAPLMLPPLDACIDCASDDTIFPPHLAKRLGVDPGAMPTGQACLVGGSIINVNFAPLRLLLSDGYATCEWDAVVAFATVPMRWALLGHAAFLEFFDVHLLGARRAVVVVPNVAFAGQQIIHTTRLP